MFACRLFEPKAWIAASAVICLGGCAGTIDHVDRRTVELNKSVSRAANEAALLNIVRVIKGEPLRFANLSSITGHDTYIGLAAVPSLTFGWHPKSAPRTFLFGPNSLTLNRSDDFSVNVVDDPGTYQALMAPVTPATFGYLQAQGYETKLLAALFIDKIGYVSPTMIAADDSRNQTLLCQYPPSSPGGADAASGSDKANLSVYIVHAAAGGGASVEPLRQSGVAAKPAEQSQCGSVTPEKAGSIKADVRYVTKYLRNDPRYYPKYHFPDGSHILPSTVDAFSGFVDQVKEFSDVDLRVETDIIRPASDTGQPITIAPGLANVRYRTCLHPDQPNRPRMSDAEMEQNPTRVVCFDSGDLTKKTADPTYVWEIPAIDQSRARRLEVTLRSTFGVYQYLKLIYNQNDLPGDVPAIRITHAKTGCAVHVNYSGEDWCIPEKKAGDRDDTLLVLDILHQLLALNLSAQSQGSSTQTVRTVN